MVVKLDKLFRKDVFFSILINKMHRNIDRQTNRCRQIDSSRKILVCPFKIPSVYIKIVNCFNTEERRMS